MLPNVETHLQPLGELTAETLGLEGARREALQTAQALELPRWKRTDLGKFDPAVLRPVFGAAEIEPAPVADGVYVADLQTARTERPELVATYWGTAVKADHNKFVALNAALAQDGIVVHVPRNVEVSAPIRVRYRLPEAGVAVFPRTLVVAEANSRVTVVEEFVGDDLTGDGLVAPVAEIFALDGAQVEFMSLQTLGKGTYQLGAQTAVVERDARIFWLCGAVGASVQHLAMDVRLQGNGSELNWLGFTYGTEQQQLLWAPTVRHIGLSTTAQITWQSAVAGNAYVVFDGMIDIHRGAQGTNSDLRDNVLHLSPQARNDSIPGLMIEANEVKAGHGSTSGQIDEEQVLYLRSRGFSEADAVRAIVQGFFAAVVEQVPVEELRDTVLELIEQKM